MVGVSDWQFFFVLIAIPAVTVIAAVIPHVQEAWRELKLEVRNLRRPLP
jgi:hypothetical protein